MELFHGKAKKMNHVRKASHYMAEKQTTEVFGVVGSSHGVGVTYVSILLANYMTGIKNRKTAILEWNSNGDFDRIESICCKKTVLKAVSQTFKVLEVSYIKQAGKKELLECINQGFDTVIIDFGSDIEQIRDEFLRCDRKFLVGSFCEWKIEAFIDLIIKKKSEEGRWDFLTALGSEEAAAEMKQTMHIHVNQVPESTDAFTITGKIIAFFEGFLSY